MSKTMRAALVAALGLLVATAGVTDPGPSSPVAVEAAPVAPAAPEAAGPDVSFDGESGSLAGVPESTNATVASAAARRGNGGLRLSASAAASYARWNTTVVPQGHTHASVQAWVRVISRAAGESVDLMTVNNTLGTAHFDFFVNGATQRFQWDLFRDDTADTDFTVVYNRWYLVELQVEFAGTEHSAQVRIDGVVQDSIHSAASASAVKMLNVGTSAAKTHVQHYDDIEMRVGDAPLGWLANTPPQVSLTRPAEGAVLGDDQVVAADFACTATDHAIASCVGTTADGAPVDTAALGAHAYTVTATDAAGYTTTRTTHYTVVDDDDPTIEVTSPANGQVVARGGNLVADFACHDDGSGLSPTGGCVGTVDTGLALDTSTAGVHPFTVTATDAAGNQAAWRGSYTVAHNRPDVAIRSTARARYGGDDVYSATGAGQTTQATIGDQSAVSFLVRVENDGRATDTFHLRGVRARPGWSVRYYAGSREISAAVHAGTYELTHLGPGQGRIVRIVVRPLPGATADRQDVTLTASGGTARDAVRAIVRRR